jgi:hypothetical protein
MNHLDLMLMSVSHGRATRPKSIAGERRNWHGSLLASFGNQNWRREEKRWGRPFMRSLIMLTTMEGALKHEGLHYHYRDFPMTLAIQPNIASQR